MADLKPQLLIAYRVYECARAGGWVAGSQMKQQTPCGSYIIMDKIQKFSGSCKSNCHYAFFNHRDNQMKIKANFELKREANYFCKFPLSKQTKY